VSLIIEKKQPKEIKRKMPTPLRFNVSRQRADKATHTSIYIGVGIGGGIVLILLIVIVILWRKKVAKMNMAKLK
jgi:hypothetical protein